MRVVYNSFRDNKSFIQRRKKKNLKKKLIPLFVVSSILNNTFGLQNIYLSLHNCIKVFSLSNFSNHFYFRQYSDKFFVLTIALSFNANVFTNSWYQNTIAGIQLHSSDLAERKKKIKENYASVTIISRFSRLTASWYFLRHVWPIPAITPRLNIFDRNYLPYSQQEITCTRYYYIIVFIFKEILKEIKYRIMFDF